MSSRPAPFTASSVATVRLIATREVNARLRTKSFAVGTALILVVLVGFFILQSTLSGGAQHSTIGLAGSATDIAKQLDTQASQHGADIETRSVSDATEGRELVTNGDIDALVFGSATEPRVLVESDLDTSVRRAIAGAARSEALTAKLADLGADPREALVDVNDTTVDVSVLDPPDPGQTQRQVIGMIIVLLMFFGIMMYGTLVTQGIVEEKSSRIVEILLATVRPWQLMFGKVLGLGLVGLIQLTIIGVAGIITASATGVLTISGAASGMLAWGLLWYVLGFFAYATVFAAAGSLVSRQEDAQSVITPVTMVLAIGYVVGINLVLQNPDSAATTWVSMIPLFSPIMMPGRIALGVAPFWQVLLAILLTLGAIALFTWIGGKIYRGAVLHTGGRVKLADAIRA